MRILPIIGILVVVRRDYWQWFWTYFGLFVFDFMFIMHDPFSNEIVGISWLVWLLQAASILLVVSIIYFLVKLQQRLTVRPPANFDILNLLLIALFFVQYYILAFFEKSPVAFRLPYSLLCQGILALGIVVCLRTRWRWLRLMSLLGAIVLALYMANTASGIY
ncbi:MAG: hypothetical protein P8074_26685 [Anaerolineales bacterium]